MINLGSTLYERGSGSGLVLPIVIGEIVYWCCQKPQSKDDRPTTSVTYTAPESTNLGSPEKQDSTLLLGRSL